MGADTTSASFVARDCDVGSRFSGAFFSISGGKSVVLCFPSVQGGISRNSSKVKTLGLQHFQPSMYQNDESENVLVLSITFAIKEITGPHTFLPLVEDWRTRMVNTDLVRIGVDLAATFVDTFLGHYRTRLRRFDNISRLGRCLSKLGEFELVFVFG